MTLTADQLKVEQKKFIIDQRKSMVDSVKRLIIFTATLAMATLFHGAFQEAVKLVREPGQNQAPMLALIELALICAVFLTTLLPFMHGSIRIMDIVYGSDWKPHPKPANFLLSFLLLLINIAPFFVMAGVINLGTSLTSLDIGLDAKVFWFFFAHVALMFFNVLVLAVFLCVQSASKSEKFHDFPAQCLWILINTVVGVFGVGLYWVWARYIVEPGQCPTSIFLPVLLYSVIAIIRNFADYALCWNFYMPNPVMFDASGNFSAPEAAMNEDDEVSARKYMLARMEIHDRVVSRSDAYMRFLDLAVAVSFLSVVVATIFLANGGFARCYSP